MWAFSVSWQTVNYSKLLYFYSCLHGTASKRVNTVGCFSVSFVSECSQHLLNYFNFWKLKVRVDISTDEKGSWKTSLTFSQQRFKNNIQCCISVSFRAMGKATNMTSKAHYAIFVKGGLVDGNWAFFKTTAYRDETFHSAAFPYQSSVITNMEKLSRFCGTYSGQSTENTNNTAFWVTIRLSRKKKSCHVLSHILFWRYIKQFFLWCKIKIKKI